jgi:phospholipid/cholesterol/gamma-HCH transport system substrate-binding protein
VNIKAFKVGIISFLLISAISILLIWKSGLLLKASGTELYGSFDTINGLLNGAEVRYRGYKIGQVFEINPQPKEILVKFLVEEGVDIPTGSKLKVVFDGLVGEKYLGISPNFESTKMVVSGDTLYGRASLGLASFVDIGAKNLETTKEILDTFNQIFSSEDVASSIKNGLLQIEQIATQLSRITEEIGSFSEEQALSNIVENFRAVSDQIRTASEALIVENNLPERMNNISRDSETLISNMALISGQLEGGLFTSSNMTKLDDTINNINILSNELKTMFGGEDTSSTSNSIVRKATSMVTSISSIKVVGESKFEYSTADEISYFDVGLDLKFPKTFFRFGLGNRSGATQFFNVQHGLELTPSFAARYGLIFMHPGIGFDYYVADPVKLSLDIYDPNKIQFELYSRVRLFEKLGVVLGIRSNSEGNVYNNYSFGLSYSVR